MLRVLLALVLALPLAAQKKQITLDAIYDPEHKISFGGAIQNDFRWIDDDTFVWPAKDESGTFVEWRVFDARTGATRVLPITDEGAIFNDDYTSAVITKDDDLYLVT